MKYLREYKENKADLTEQDIKDLFAGSFDLCEKHSIRRTDWVAKKSLEENGVKLGWSIMFYFSNKIIGSTFNLSQLGDFSNLLSDIHHDVNRVKEMYDINEENIMFTFDSIATKNPSITLILYENL